MIEKVNMLIESGTMPFLVAILLGLISAISPCPLTTNISALGYIAKNIGDKRRVILDGLYYALGRIITYTVLGSVTIFILRRGASIAPINNFLSEYGEMILPPILIIMAIVTLDIIHIGNKHNHSAGTCSTHKSKFSKKGGGALMMGLIFALAFCPINGMFFFGMLSPVAAAAKGGYLMPFIYGLITGLPVVIVSWLLAYSVGQISSFHSKMAKIEKWCRIFVATMLIIFAGYFSYHAYFESGHDHSHNHSHDKHKHTEECNHD